MTFTILVSGAGIGGLTFARAISVLASEQPQGNESRKVDIEVIVVERSKILPTTGHGLTLFEGVGILSRLGLKDQLDDISSILTKQIVTADGKHVTSNEIEGENREFYPRSVRRPDLVQMLYDTLVVKNDKNNNEKKNSVKISVKFDWEVVGVELLRGGVGDNKNKKSKIKIMNQDQEEIIGDILVGFDGINSHARTAINDSIATSTSRTTRSDSNRRCNNSNRDGREFGQCCVLLGTADYIRDAAKSSIAGKSAMTPPPPETLVHHFDRTTGSVGVYSSVASGGGNSRSYAWTIGYRCLTDPGRNPNWNDSQKALAVSQNLVTNGWSSESASSNVSPNASMNNYDFRSLLSCSKGCMQLGVYMQSSTHATQPWHYGSCMVIGGDSAHAVLPLLGEGANLAICDSVVLARHIMPCILNSSNNGDDTSSSGRNDEKYSDAFQKYEAERRPFGQSGVTMTKYLRPIMLSQSRVVCYLRNMFMGHMLKYSWSQSYLRAQDAYKLLDMPMRNRNPHANIGLNDIGTVLAHVVVIGGCATAMAWYYATRK